MDIAVIAAVIGAVATVIAAILGAWFTKRLPEKQTKDKTQINGQGEIKLQSFSINPTKCSYKEHIIDPDKLLWPREDQGAVVFHGGYIIEMYGQKFSSSEELREYEAMLERTRNHRSFSENSIHKLFFERLNIGDDEEPNYPNFYLSVSNGSDRHVILNAIEAIVIDVHPLESLGRQSHGLPSLVTYQLRVAPHSGNTRAPLIPNLKIEANDAAAFDVFLLPETSRVGGHLWLMKLKFYHSEHGFIETDVFNIIM